MGLLEYSNNGRLIITPKRLKIIIPVIITVIGVGFSLVFFFRGEEEFQLIPKPKTAKETGSEVIGIEVGTGWSIRESPEEAVREAVEMALEGRENKSPDFAAVFASSGTDLQAILLEARKLLGNETKIYGGTSDSRAVMTDKGFVKVSKTGYDYAAIEGKRGLAIMTVTSKDIIFGVGSANFSLYPSVQEASKAAILMNYTNKGGPFIATFTWGEQGHFHGIGTKHSNLLTSFLVIGHKERG
jgi:hypothetical protein